MSLLGRCLPLLLLAVVAAQSAHADADAPSSERVRPVPAWDEWPVERNAQQLQKREWKVGLFGFDGGLHDRVQIGTVWAPWALLGFNVHLKAMAVDHNGWKLGVETSFFYVNLDRLAWFGVHDLQGKLFVLPLTLQVDKLVHPRVLVGLGSSYSFSHTSPEYDPKDLDGTGAYDSWLLRGHVTGRVSPAVWLSAEVDWVLYQSAGAQGAIDTQVDPYVHATGEASAVVTPLSPARAGSVTLSMIVRARRFGMRLGFGYGQLAVPRLRLVVPTAIPYVVFDVFGRFGNTKTGSE